MATMGGKRTFAAFWMTDRNGSIADWLLLLTISKYADIWTLAIGGHSLRLRDPRSIKQTCRGFRVIRFT